MANKNQNFHIEKVLSLTNVTRLIKQGLVEIWGWDFINANAAVEFVQLFNAASTSDVVLGTTPPDLVLAVTTGVGSAVFTMLPEEDKITFDRGLVVACTTTETGSSAPATAPINTYWFVN